MSQYNIIASTNESTVVSEYVSTLNYAGSYQSEAELEKTFIQQLVSQGYTYLDIHSNDELVQNLRVQLERLNNFQFSNQEWTLFFSKVISNPNMGIVEKTKLIQQEAIQVLQRDDGTVKNIMLIDKEHVHNNSVQVINQYVENNGNYENRYDVTILVNGLPMVHVELKRRGIALKEAFNQIERYQKDSFWASSGLYEYVQIFVISNGIRTKYYSNSTRINCIKEVGNKKKIQKTSNSFEFTSFWADANNKVIADIVDFTNTFFQKHILLNILTKYCVLTSENMLLVMRPYQIVATEKILNRIETSTNYKQIGTIKAGGYIWHTTGSGKTLTSFKASQIASQLPYIDKVLFVVDRCDLDYQTMKEYDRFEKGAANGNTSTKILQQQLEDKDFMGNPHKNKIIVTTIQKLTHFLKANPKHPVLNQHVVIIFDECHRSQFGSMHALIASHFKKYHLFGFTGTPILSQNTGSGKNPTLCTTEQAFGDRLHAYTIVDAINDKNVLPFKIDYVNTIKRGKDKKDVRVEAINSDSALLAPKRISNVTGYILEHFNQKTKRNNCYYSFAKLVNTSNVASNAATQEKRLMVKRNGFNAIFAVSSIEAAMLYYRELKKQLNNTNNPSLKVATIYSYNPNEGEQDWLVSDEDIDNAEALDMNAREFLEEAISDYNKMFGTNYSTSKDKFSNYYKDLSLRMKNGDIDLLIVVNMFLTGFDATTLNTLWVDKNLKQHSLIQAFSRTNRIYNSVKSFGNIVCFRDLQKETEEAIALFGDKDATGVVLMRNYDDYYYGFETDDGKHQKGYLEQIQLLLSKFPLPATIQGKKAKKEFISLFSNILRLRNILSTFDDFERDTAISSMEYEDYVGIYNECYEEFRQQVQSENIEDDVIFEMELVRQLEVNIDYILLLVEKYHEKNCEDKEILANIERAIKLSASLRSKKELIDQFIASINAKTNVEQQWKIFVMKQYEKELSEIATEERLNLEEAKKYLSIAFENGYIKFEGTELDNVLPPMSRFSGNRTENKQRIINKLKMFFDKYVDII